MKHCEPDQHDWKDKADGTKHCLRCGHHRCPDGQCVLALNPVALRLYPTLYEAICRKCGQKTTWPPPHVVATMPPATSHTTEDYARHAARFGHPPPERQDPPIPVPLCAVCRAPATRYSARQKPICHKRTCEG